ncbi:MAG: hypothetical protein KDK39_12925 [Leptospiraceae bacterium]|nr:hypothetical protein [Leptospiraceae bacterium]
MRAFVLICLFLLVQGPLSAWELIYQKNGVQVYRRQAPNSPIHEMRGQAILPCPMLEVLSVVLDYKHFKEWQPHLIRFERLQTINDETFINYAAVSMPWPVQDRDMVMQARFQIEAPKRQFQVHWRDTSWPDRPPTKQYVRVASSRVIWSLSPVDQGRSTRVSFQALGDPGGWIPAWLVNWFSRYMIADSFERLQRRIEQKKFNALYVQRFRFVEDWY